MKFTIPRDRLSAALSLPSSVANGKMRPVLGNVLLDAGDNLALLATDTEIGCGVLTEADISEGGTVLVPAAKLSQVLAVVNSESVTVGTRGNGVEIVAGKSRFTLPTADVADFPRASIAGHKGEGVTIPAAIFQSACKRTSFCTDPSSTRFALGGVELSQEGFASTDGKRLSLFECELAGWTSCIATTKFLSLASRDCSGEVRLSHDGSTLVVSSGNVTICGRLVEGRFPRVSEVVGKSLKDTERVNMLAGDLLNVAKQCQVTSDAETRAMDMAFSTGTLSAKSRATSGESEVEAVVGYAGKPIALALDPSYLVEFLRLLDPEAEIVVNIRDGGSPLVIVAGASKYVVMPLEVVK